MSIMDEKISFKRTLFLQLTNSSNQIRWTLISFRYWWFMQKRKKMSLKMDHSDGQFIILSLKTIHKNYLKKLQVMVLKKRGGKLYNNIALWYESNLRKCHKGDYSESGSITHLQEGKERKKNSLPFNFNILFSSTFKWYLVRGNMCGLLLIYN